MSHGVTKRMESLQPISIVIVDSDEIDDAICFGPMGLRGAEDFSRKVRRFLPESYDVYVVNGYRTKHTGVAREILGIAPPHA